ncbi:MAG: addiction module toxin RelE [Selenomonas sp.]|uniref:addiction module toxin RelE n=1 Tax=Selenomonas sp. TaxID=2053611 RepID=UPI0025E11FA6|nr:addiction module toxin RelE [Selenomonas sp.]MCR5757441.1 addiction module toxin RelE [Selenomonas sp.]
MITFPLFTELEKHRDAANENFHRNVSPQLIDRLKTFGFEQISKDDVEIMQIQEKSTQNKYVLAIHKYEITIHFHHVKTGEQLLICSISNFELSAHVILDIIIDSIDSWLQYGEIYDYKAAQNLTERAKRRS